MLAKRCREWRVRSGLRQGSVLLSSVVAVVVGAEVVAYEGDAGLDSRQRDGKGRGSAA